VAKAFADAAHVVSCDLVNNRIVAAAMEPRIALGRFDPASGRLPPALSGASVHAIRRELAEGVFRVPLDRIEVSCPDVGGGFGMKNVTYPEYALVLWAARKLGRPVHWTADRLEEFTSGVHGRDNLTQVPGSRSTPRAASWRWRSRRLGNLGAYVSSLGPVPRPMRPRPRWAGSTRSRQ
jgi:carbon-monoxide dehydrogenase large subunit